VQVAGGVVVVLVVIASTGFSPLVVWACSSGEEARGSVEADLCAALDPVGSAGWWLATLWPVALFAASQLSPSLRRNALLAGFCVAALTVAFWAIVGVVVIDV
jgi:hypothetical protein